MNTITRERLLTIQQWRETYGPGSNVVLPAEEAEELARSALASLEAEPAIHRWRRVTVEPYGPYPWHYGNFIGFSKPVEGIEDEYFYSAPPAPVVPDDVMAAIQKVARIRLDLNDFDGDKRGILDCLSEAEEALIEVVNRRAAILNGEKS
ncbi:TPA: dTDP-6-deoxy-D-glucose-3,5-epimerase [Enterobacter hormaechei]|nr:dTDP-6-deoxy-D-glucose-3,5-epimerase [Enterobacter hormaechei]